MASTSSDQWLRHGQNEHASVASFSRFSLDLLRFAAPPQLLSAAHTAAADEVKHAQLAFDLATRIRGETSMCVQVHPFPVASVELSHSFSEFVARTLKEGCIGESAAIVRLAFALPLLQRGSPARPVLEQLLMDEARHAALAWATVLWAADVGTVPVRDYHPTELRVPFGTTAPLDLQLTWAGRLPQDTADELTTFTEQIWVGPWFAAVANGVASLPPLATPPGEVGQAIAKAVELVREALTPLLVNRDKVVVL